MVRVTGNLEAAQAARTHTRTEAMEDGSSDASAGWNCIKDNEAAGKVFKHPVASESLPAFSDRI